MHLNAHNENKCSIDYYVPDGKYSDDIVVISPFPAPL